MIPDHFNAPDALGTELVAGLGPGSLLGCFNRAGLLAPADVHVAMTLGRLGGDPDELVALAAALAVRAPRKGHVLVDLATVSATATVEAGDDTQLVGLPWPDLATWLERLSASPLVARAAAADDDLPLRLVGSALYLDRYWRDEDLVATGLASRIGAPLFEVDEPLLAEGVRRLFQGDHDGRQGRAAVTSVRRHFSVIAGGPGTGKTSTVARLLALLAEQAGASGKPAPLVALGAPTGKAAARMEESVHAEAARLAVSEEVKRELYALRASTVHRLLGRHPASATRFRHDRRNQLPHEVVVVDETSMMSLSLMARLLEAVRDDARLVLLGDQEQLASVEAGNVLGDIVGPAASELVATAAPAPGISGSITVLRANHRFQGELATLAEAVRAGDPRTALAILGDRVAVSTRAPEQGVAWLPIDATAAPDAALAPVRDAVETAGRPLLEAAAKGDGAQAIDAMSRLRLLCAHRDGPSGASTWNLRAQQWLGVGLGSPSAGAEGWWVGRPVTVTLNDYSLGLFNGDAGVAVGAMGNPVSVVFRRAAGLVEVSPSRLQGVETAFAMTAHRAQGSEFDQVIVILPAGVSRVLTRELLYTAITRARRAVLLVGTNESVSAAIDRPVARSSGLTARLWGCVPLAPDPRPFDYRASDGRAAGDAPR